MTAARNGFDPGKQVSGRALIGAELGGRRNVDWLSCCIRISGLDVTSRALSLDAGSQHVAQGVGVRGASWS